MNQKLQPMENLRNQLKRMESQFSLVLPKHVPVEKFAVALMLRLTRVLPPPKLDWWMRTVDPSLASVTAGREAYT